MATGNFLTDEKLLIVGAGGMIGSNMAQIAAMLRLTPNICLYDVYEPGNNGVLLEMQHSAFPRMRFIATTDPKEAFTGAKYIVSSGGAPRKEGMTREDLLKGNCEIAAGLGDNIRKYCPEVKHVMIIFNPADVTALTVLIHSGLRPCRVSSLAALDSTRLQTNLAKEFGVRQSDVENAFTYGGHGESMAVFMSKATICGTPIARMGLTKERIEAIKHDTIQGGAEIIKLRGRSSIQSPALLSIKAIEAAMPGGDQFPWPSGTYFHGHAYLHGRHRHPLHDARRQQGGDGGPQGLLRPPGGPPRPDHRAGHHPAGGRVAQDEPVPLEPETAAHEIRRPSYRKPWSQRPGFFDYLSFSSGTVPGITSSGGSP